MPGITPTIYCASCSHGDNRHEWMRDDFQPCRKWGCECLLYTKPDIEARARLTLEQHAPDWLRAWEASPRQNRRRGL